ncbi:hypothetical protein Pla110_15640 [Polystyrenella longa]|uniref:VWFA domain-containing protein n=1 Tax=Polystyrenella longa TaxID=2528007 RepID=A0A518CKU3_9PLAN|nr:VWA domain-containing protein [Polystyrenella longa]QDU79845.1 hypothetical protein Pla110_15640 [Polystyrenella longa]
MSISYSDKLNAPASPPQAGSVTVDAPAPVVFQPETKSPTTEYRKWFTSLSLSTFVHLLVILLLAQLMMSIPAGTAYVEVETTWQDAADKAPEIEEIQIETVKETEQDSPAPTLVQPTTQAVAVPSPLLSDLASPLDNSWESDLESLDLTGNIGELSYGSGVDGSGSQGFFNSDVSGKDIVYVVDGSASMNSPYPGREKTRFGRVKIELIRAIRSMSPEQKFYIIFFNTEATPMPGRRMLPAGEENADEALIWMSKHRANGETDPSTAIQLALSLKPDVIHFLTDGEINPQLIETVRGVNRSRVSINTYCISNRDGEKVVLKLAQQNEGRYKFVP